MAKQYKVLTSKDKFFGKRFDPAKLEELLNEWAKHGWVLKSITNSEHGVDTAFSKERQELIIVLEWDDQKH